MIYGLDPISLIKIWIPTLRVAKADVTKNNYDILDHIVFFDEWS